MTAEDFTRLLETASERETGERRDLADRVAIVQEVLEGLIGEVRAAHERIDALPGEFDRNGLESMMALVADANRQTAIAQEQVRLLAMSTHTPDLLLDLSADLAAASVEHPELYKELLKNMNTNGENDE
jgi:hypothetical protein